MHSFKSFITEQAINERVISIGLNDKHDEDREKYRSEIHDMIHKAYSHPDIGGYGGSPSGSKQESDAIHHDISNSVIKATRRGGKITAVNLYKKQHGRKSIASATDATDQGKKDWMKTKLEDHEQKRAWGEVSGKAETLQKKLGVPVIPANKVGKLLGKHIEVKQDGEHYSRAIGGQEHTKIAMGHPKT
jgi:hypothetical protein